MRGNKNAPIKKILGELLSTFLFKNLSYNLLLLFPVSQNPTRSTDLSLLRSLILTIRNSFSNSRIMFSCELLIYVNMSWKSNLPSNNTPFDYQITLISPEKILGKLCNPMLITNERLELYFKRKCNYHHSGLIINLRVLFTQHLNYDQTSAVNPLTYTYLRRHQLIQLKD